MMRKKKLSGWMMCVCTAAVICGCGSKDFKNPSRGETLVMATNAYMEPYSYYAEDQIVGIDVEIAQAIADKLGMELEVRNMELDSVFDELNAGRAHIGMAGINAAEEHLEDADFSDPYMRIEQAVIVDADSEAAAVSDFSDGLIGVPARAAGEIVASDLTGAQVRSYDSGADAVQALLNNTIDAVILDRTSAEELTEGTEELKILEEAFIARGCSIAVAKGNEELLDDVDKALDAIIADGTVFRITNKYITAE